MSPKMSLLVEASSTALYLLQGMIMLGILTAPTLPAIVQCGCILCAVLRFALQARDLQATIRQQGLSTRSKTSLPVNIFDVTLSLSQCMILLGILTAPTAHVLVRYGCTLRAYHQLALQTNNLLKTIQQQGLSTMSKTSLLVKAISIILYSLQGILLLMCSNSPWTTLISAGCSLCKILQLII